MTTPTAARVTPKRDVAKFLAAHEECASDFDIRRGGGIGKGLRLTCNGCGTRAAYAAAEPGVLKLIDPPGPIETGRGRRLSREEVERWLPAPAALPWWIPNAYILGVIAIGLGVIAFGVARSSEKDPVVVGERRQPTAAIPPPVVASPPRPNAPAASKAQPLAKAPALDEVTVLGRFRIGVASGWLRGASGGAVVFRTVDGDAEVRVFLEPGDAGPRRLSRRATAFLRSEHRGATISKSRDVRVGGDPAVAVAARYKGGRQRALLLSESGYEYLLLSRVDRSASRTEKAAALSVLMSFRAL